MALAKLPLAGLLLLASLTSCIARRGLISYADLETVRPWGGGHNHGRLMHNLSDHGSSSSPSGSPTGDGPQTCAGGRGASTGGLAEDPDVDSCCCEVCEIQQMPLQDGDEGSCCYSFIRVAAEPDPGTLSDDPSDPEGPIVGYWGCCNCQDGTWVFEWVQPNITTQDLSLEWVKNVKQQSGSKMKKLGLGFQASEPKYETYSDGPISKLGHAAQYSPINVHSTTMKETQDSEPIHDEAHNVEQDNGPTERET